MQATHEEKFGSMARQMGQWVDHVLGRGYHKYSPEESWSPAMNLYEDATHYYVVVDLAGVDPKEINVHAEGRTLVLSGYRQTPEMSEASGSVRMHHMEIDHGRFCRPLELPEDIDADRIEANYKRGFLWIHLPKNS
ncbi:MAG: Hsp20/alpha crystallin family protein [Planctomycetota bacterium]|jgi:HSP20 family protein